MTTVHFDCLVAVNYTVDRHLQFRYQYWQRNPWFGPKGCIQEFPLLQLARVVSLILYISSTASVCGMSSMVPITIQQDSVWSSVEWLTGSQDSWSQQQNSLQSLRIGIWLLPPMVRVGEWLLGTMVVCEELRAWDCLASVFYLVSSGCFLSVSSMGKCSTNKRTPGRSVTLSHWSVHYQMAVG
jgi:hypothetical protein